MKSQSASHAVSPVVGVMLMLVVTIIIAAVVTGFSGEMLGGTTTQKAPSLLMDVKVINTGYWSGSGFSATVTAVSKPISTSDIKLVTSWTITNKTTGEQDTGGNTVIPGETNINHKVCNPYEALNSPAVAPFGGGSGVSDGTWFAGYVSNDSSSQFFGNYMLVPGTTLSAPTQQGTCNTMYATQQPKDYYNLIEYCVYGAEELYKYPICAYYDPTAKDPTVAVLGLGWEQLRAGDTVNVKVIYMPTGSIIFNKNILVTDG